MNISKMASLLLFLNMSKLIDLRVMFPADEDSYRLTANYKK
jgi:hypothetical protein